MLHLLLPILKILLGIMLLMAMPSCDLFQKQPIKVVDLRTPGASGSGKKPPPGKQPKTTAVIVQETLQEADKFVQFVEDGKPNEVKQAGKALEDYFQQRLTKYASSDLHNAVLEAYYDKACQAAQEMTQGSENSAQAFKDFAAQSDDESKNLVKVTFPVAFQFCKAIRARFNAETQSLEIKLQTHIDSYSNSIEHNLIEFSNIQQSILLLYNLCIDMVKIPVVKDAIPPAAYQLVENAMKVASNNRGAARSIGSYKNEPIQTYILNNNIMNQLLVQALKIIGEADA